MDCLTAQSLISEAMDRQPLDAALLAEAKEHCRTCADCARFVRGQLLAKQAQLPQPPADLADRVIATVRAEAQRKAEHAAAEAEAARAAARAAEQPGDQSDAVESATSQPVAAEPIATLASPGPRTRRRLPRPMVIGGLAAAALVALLGAGSVVIFGMRQLTPQKAVTSSTYLVNPQAGTTAGAAQGYGRAGGAAPAAPSGAALQKNSEAATAGPEDITVNGVAYALTGPAGLDLTGRAGIGQTTSSLAGTTTPTSRTVFAGTTPDTVYVADDKGQALSFTRVTRTYLGQAYVLTAAELTGFGQWPGLPSQIPAPASTDGQPTFLFDGTDSQGVRVYRLSTSPATAGIAIAPKTDTGGPVAGDPNWTWWTPLR